MTITPEIIAKVQGFGFDVYMRNPTDTYMLFTDGKNIGYMQVDRLCGYSLRTVHMPSRSFGTGFQVKRHSENFNKSDLEQCFSTHVPSWIHVYNEDDRVIKYRDIDDYRSSNSFNAGYKLVEKVTLPSNED